MGRKKENHCTNTNHMKTVRGKVTLITGAASGLGRLLAIEFAKRGAILVLWDVQFALLEETKEIVNQKFPDVDVHIYQCDLSIRDSIYSCCDTVLEQVGPVNILVNNAGIVTGKNFLSCPENLIERTMAVNVMAHMWLAKKILPYMIEKNEGHIVTISSAASTTGVPGLADYCASKWAATGFEESIRMELRHIGATGVKTLCVCPYYINTGMFDGVQSRIIPILEPDYVVRKIMNAVAHDSPTLYLPRMVGLIYILRGLLPTRWWDWISRVIGINRTMDSFKGRGDNWALGKENKQ